MQITKQRLNTTFLAEQDCTKKDKKAVKKLSFILCNNIWIYLAFGSTLTFCFFWQLLAALYCALKKFVLQKQVLTFRTLSELLILYLKFSQFLHTL